MDSLASIGRFWASPQFYVTLVISLVFIGVGIYMVVTQKQETIPGVPDSQTKPPTILGTVLIIYGVAMLFLSWIRRKLIRSNPGVAAVAGFLDVSAIFRYIFKA